MLARSQSVGAFVKKVWELVGGGKQLGVAYDQVLNSSCLNLFVSSPLRSALVLIAIFLKHVIRSKGLSLASWCLTLHCAHAMSKRSKTPPLSTSEGSYRSLKFRHPARRPPM